MKLVASAVVAVMLAGAVFAAPAEARCWWTDTGWRCSHPVLQHHHYRLPSPSWGY